MPLRGVGRVAAARRVGALLRLFAKRGAVPVEVRGGMFLVVAAAGVFIIWLTCVCVWVLSKPNAGGGAHRGGGGGGGRGGRRPA